MASGLLLVETALAVCRPQCIVMSDTNQFMCGSESAAVISPGGIRLLVPYLALANGFGECHDITVIADMPLGRPQAATSHIVCKIDEADVLRS